MFIAGHIGARIGVGTTVTMDPDTGHTSRRMDMDRRIGVGTHTGHTSRPTDMDTRISRPTAMAITSNRILGMAPSTGNGGSSDRAVGIVGEKPHGPFACSG